MAPRTTSNTVAFLIFAALARLTLAEPVPTTPGSTDVYAIGSDCKIAWTPDTTGTWKEMNIQLMSGPNSPMIHMRTVTTIDATTESSFSWTCPDVTPTSQIYFYQFSSPSDPTMLTWSTRFTISAADGSSTPPESTDPTSGVKYGTGTFTDASEYNAPPAYLAGNGQIDGGSSSSSGSGGDSGSASGTDSAASGSPTSPGTLPPATNTVSGGSMSTITNSAALSDSGVSSTATDSAMSTSTSNAAGVAVQVPFASMACVGFTLVTSLVAAIAL